MILPEAWAIPFVNQTRSMQVISVEEKIAAAWAAFGAPISSLTGIPSCSPGMCTGPRQVCGVRRPTPSWVMADTDLQGMRRAAVQGEAPAKIPELVVLGVVSSNVLHEVQLRLRLIATGLPAAPVPIPGTIIGGAQLDGLHATASDLNLC